MNNIDTTNWHTFKLSEVFYEPDTGKDLIYRELTEGKYPVIGHCKENNGVTAWTEKLDDYKLYNHQKTISLGDRGCFVAYVQPLDFYIGTRVKALTSRNKSSNIYQLQFIATCINLEQFKFCYGRNATDKVSDIKIKLPAILENGKYEPNWLYMEKYIKESTQSLPKTKNKNPKINLKISEWHDFKIKNIFDRIESTKGVTTDLLTEGNDIPYIAAKESNNGLKQMVAYEGNEEYISQGNCIVFIQLGAGSAGYTTYQPSTFVGMSGKTSCGYSKYLNKYNAIFLKKIFDLERPKYNFGRSWTGDRLLETVVKLPAKENKSKEYVPDWIFMENYIKNLPYGDLI